MSERTGGSYDDALDKSMYTTTVLLCCLYENSPTPVPVTMALNTISVNLPTNITLDNNTTSQKNSEPTINRFPGLIAEHLPVKFGDPHCIGF